MAFTLDAVSNNGARNDSPGSSVSWNHTLGGSANFLVVGTRNYDSPPVIAVSGVTANGSAMTQLPTFSPTGPSDDNLTYWYIENPTTGTISITVTFASSGTGQFNGVATSWIVDSLPVSIVDSDASGFTRATSHSVTLTGLSTGNLLVGICGGENLNLSAGTGVTEQTDSGQLGMYSMVADASSETMTVNHFNDYYELVAAAFSESGGGGGSPTPTLMMLGVGS